MSSPGPILTQVVVAGTSWLPTFELKKASGDLYDLSPASVDVTLRLSKDNGTTVVTRKKSSGETAFPTDGSDGQIIFVFETAATAGIEAGLYAMEVVFEDANTSPPEKTVVGRGLVKWEQPKTGAI